MALETVGTSDALFPLVLAYVKDRQQFGVPIGSFQAVKHKMTNMFVAIERARSLCYYAVAAIDEDAPDRASSRVHGQGGQRRLPAPGLPGLVPVLRRHRLHLGARRPSVPQARHDDRRALRRSTSSTHCASRPAHGSGHGVLTGRLA